MISIGKKILSAFVDVTDDKIPAPSTIPESVATPAIKQNAQSLTDGSSRFAEHFNTLFAEAALPGPNYYEFSKMIDVMQVVADEKARYSAAFAGLQVQGLDKQKLLASAQKYLQILDSDAAGFEGTIGVAFREKVGSKREETEAAKTEITKLSQQIIGLQQQITTWTEEIAENEEKIKRSNNGYHNALESCKGRLLQDIEKINQHII